MKKTLLAATLMAFAATAFAEQPARKAPQKRPYSSAKAPKYGSMTQRQQGPGHQGYQPAPHQSSEARESQHESETQGYQNGPQMRPDHHGYQGAPQQKQGQPSYQGNHQPNPGHQSHQGGPQQGPSSQGYQGTPQQGYQSGPQGPGPQPR